MPATMLGDAGVAQRPMHLPAARGPLTTAVLDALRGGTPDLDGPATAALAATDDLLRDDDVQLALFCLYERHYGGFEGVPDGLEWDGALNGLRGRLERAFEGALRAAIVPPARPEPTAEAVAAALVALTAEDVIPSLGRHLARKATHEQVREFLVHRSISTSKEADPHSWAIPRLSGKSTIKPYCDGTLKAIGFVTEPERPEGAAA